MNLPGASVARPVFATMVTLVVVVLGLMAFSRLRIDLLPDIELPSLTVRTEWEGAAPEVMEQRVTAIVEEIIATVPGVEEIISTSAEGSSTVRVRFAWGTHIDAAALDVQATLEDEINELPEDIIRPRVSKFDIASFPVVLLGISSHLDPVELTTLIEEQIRYRFARVPGVAQVDVWGGYERELRVELDPSRLRALAVPLDTVLSAIRDANVNLPAGEIEQGNTAVRLRAPAELDGVEQVGDIVVATREGAPVRLGQIADVRDTYRKLTRLIRVNGKRGVRVAIRKEAGDNTVEVAQRVLRTIDAVNEDFPQIQVVPVINQGNFIERSIANVGNSVLYGGALAVVVLLFFLRNLRSTVVIALAIPISIVATFALLFFGGFTLNLMTLGGLALGVGMMVDNSVVVLENIFRRRAELEEGPREAAVAGAREVMPPIVASTITTLVIFLPLVFVGGVSGALFRELAYVVAFSLGCSLLVSLTVVPMLAARLLREPLGGRRGAAVAQRLSDASERAFTRVATAYHAVLSRGLARRGSTIALAFVALGASLLLLPFIGTEFLPPSDEGEVRVTGEMPTGTKLDLVDRQTRLLESYVYEAVPEATSTVVSVGATGYHPSDATQGEIRMALEPLAERSRSNTEIADALRELLEGKIPGMEIRTRAPQGQFLLQRILGAEEGLTVEVRGYDIATLSALSERVVEALGQIPGVTDVRSTFEVGVPEQAIVVDRDKAAALGVSARDVARALETAVAGTPAGEYRVAGNSYRILVQLAHAEKLPLSEVLDLTVEGSQGQSIPLRSVVSAHPGLGPMLIDRKNQQRTVTVQANIAGRPMGAVAEAASGVLDSITRPAGYELTVAGTFEEQQKSFRELVISLLLALVLVYMVLAAQYESLIDPFVVMLSVPVAAIGVLVTLAATGTTFNIQSYIGCIMLGGIVVNNAILLVDQARRLRRGGVPTVEAAREAGRRRLRPILMTTLTTILALVPLALGIGEGADAQAPLARAVLGGLTGSTLITLVLIPAVYATVHRNKRAAEHEDTEPSATRKGKGE